MEAQSNVFAAEIVRAATAVRHEGRAAPWFPCTRSVTVESAAIPSRSIETVVGSMLVGQFVDPNPRISRRAGNSRRTERFGVAANSAYTRHPGAARAQDVTEVKVSRPDLGIDISIRFVEHRAL